MSAEVVGSHAAPSASLGRAPAPRPAQAGALPVEPSLVNRLLGVAVAVFAVPALLELRRFAGAAVGPTLVQEAWLFAACGALAATSALVLARVPRLPALRPARALCALLAAEAAVLGAALLTHLAR